MIFAVKKEEMFKKYRKEFARYNEQRKPRDKSKLELVFTDMNGMNYYRFPDTMLLPIERWGKAKDYMQWMAAGISPAELDKLIDFADKALSEGLTKGAAKIGFALQELKERRNMIIHTELVYNFLAIHYIREDEPMDSVNMDIHQQKVEQFREEVARGDASFFFEQKELRKIYDPFSLSQIELTALLEQSIIKQQALKEMLQNYLSKQESESTMTDGRKS